MPKIIYYRKKCIGCGICHERHPGQWRMSRKDGKANLIGSVVNKETHIKVAPASPAMALLIANSCPAKAIRVLS